MRTLAELDEERRLLIAEIKAAFPDKPLSYGIDHRGCFARLGGLEARARDIGEALRGALAKATGVAS